MTELTKSIQSVGLCSNCSGQMTNSITFTDAEKCREVCKAHIAKEVSGLSCLNETQRITVIKAIQGVV